MNETRMPVIFSGHGSPMLALEHTTVTEGLHTIGSRILSRFGKPKAILAVSAHWYTRGTFVQRTESPKQVYDMYGFPKELYEFTYPVKGSPALADRVLDLLGDNVETDNSWGIDHGTWTVLCHMFPKADIPVVQLSVDRTIGVQAMYEIGKKLSVLRDEGYLIFASGNVVHNLGMVDWNNPSGSKETLAFNQQVIDYVTSRQDDKTMAWQLIPHASYAVPTAEHYLPLIYMLGAAEGEKPEVFNNHSELGSIAMTGFAFGM